MSSYRVALVQRRAVPRDVRQNIELAVEHIKTASERGADIVLFPEMWSNGYSLPDIEETGRADYPRIVQETREVLLAEARENEAAYVQALCAAARESRIAIVATGLSSGFTGARNTAYVIDRKGRLPMVYSKVHTCSFSREKVLERGDGFPVCELDDVKIGVMICFDREFPESARALMLNGAELILVPNACDMNRARLSQLSTRAFENMVGVAMANYPGKDWGRSCAFSPIVFDSEGRSVDNTLLLADDDLEEVLVVDFDMDAIREYRRREPWGNAYRNVAAYGVLLEPEVRKPFIRSSHL